MSVLQTRGGVPHILRESIPLAGRKWELPFVCNQVILRNKGANLIRVFFSEEDFTADENYVELPVASAIYPYGEWVAPMEAAVLWFKSVTAPSDLEAAAFQRRG